MPYYVDHAAGKGILHLTERTGVGQLPADGGLAARPQSLVDSAVWDRLTQQLQANLAVVRNGPMVAVALDDEVSLGVFNSPLEVDGSPKSVALYREWLRLQYGSIERLNAQWKTSHRAFAQVNPVPFGEVRERHRAAPLLTWNLAPWMDWRSYMDSQFADVLTRLTGHSNQLAPAVPAGIVGGQQPAAYGGFDYEKLRSSLQWIESYDIGGTNEILRSFWSYPESRPRVQTFFSTGNARQDSWFLWYYLLHGNRAVIAWPDRNGQSWFGDKRLAPFIAENRATFREVQSDRIAPLFNARSRLDADPIAVLYSHPSVQASWATDVVPHGKTWPRRSSSLDNGCQTAGKNRVAWFKLLEDCGFQYDVVSDADLVRGVLQDKHIRVLILPRAMALSDDQCQAVWRFVRDGGTVIADYWVALLDQHGTGRATGGGLDTLFGVQRDESQGYFNGQTITEIDGEKYQRPLLERLPGGNVLRHRHCMVVERGTRRVAGQAAAAVQGAEVVIQRPVGEGRAVYLNLSPVEYFANQVRLDRRGAAWRDLLTRLLADADLHPRARVFSHGAPVPMAELLFWQRGTACGWAWSRTRRAKPAWTRPPAWSR